MPIYEYQCQKCGANIEKRQSVSDEPLKVCEECGGELEKKISLSGFQFKGAGWYVTDYAAKNGKGKGAEKTSASESTAAANDASNTKGESSAAKAEAPAAKD